MTPPVRVETPERTWSLRGRLTRRLFVATGLVWCLGLGAGLAVMAHEMREIADKALAVEARVVAESLERAGPAAGAATTGAVQVRVVRPGGVADAAPWPPLDADGSREVAGWSVARVTTPGGLTVEIGQEVALRRREFWEAARVWLLVTVPLLGVLLLALRRALGAGLAPVAAFAAEMDRRRASDLSPLPHSGLPAELAPIARALDRYLARIEALLVAERDFSASAAHELRTPLAIAAAQAQLLADGRGGPTAARAVVAAVGRVTSLVQRLLDLARAEAAVGREDDRCDLLQVLRLLVADAPEGAIRVDDGDRETIEVAADADSVALVLGNLLRNACEHGTGPVRVTLGPGPALAIVNPVAPGAAFREGRFAKAPGSAGSGLGLAIARAAADRLGWRIGLEIQDGVARARVTFREP
ncbi:MAG: HAMP domain-containing sensor histidine kinase [Amaricoccus sp.]|uniref:sensor histidine kinase n=1 Tax=Amaricoccus sp. TaxID=1872485 RepID=UPI0039E72513